MSATGRAPTREELDIYATPGWATRSLLSWLDRTTQIRKFGDPLILDPGCGSGSISKELSAWSPGSTVVGVEIDERASFPYRARGPGKHASFELFDYLDPVLRAEHCAGADLVVCNPPYSRALEFVQASLSLDPRPIVAMLLRLNWMGGTCRREFHSASRAAVLVLTRRPSFKKVRKMSKKTGKMVTTSSDACEYGWFVWGTEADGTWDVLECEPAGVRR